MVRDEKQRATILGVVAALFLTVLKLFAGILSNSLAVLAEAAHSGLDLASAFTGFFAIKISERPADKEHMYGHGKADTLGGFLAALLLLVTCGWILYEGIERLFFRTALLDITLLTFVAVMISIMVDIERTLVFRRVAMKTHSPTMQANTLHFASDIASSTAVLAGLYLVTMGYLTIDTILALAIALYFGFMSIRLTRVTTSELLDMAPAGLQRRIAQVVRTVKGVESFGQIRIRKSGSRLFIDMVVNVDSRTPFIASHRIASEVENTISKRFSDSDIVVHVNPASDREGITDKIRTIALRQGAEGVHGVDVESFEDRLHVNLHLEFSPSTKIVKAHAIASKIESEVLKSMPRVKEVVTHIEPETIGDKALKTESKSKVDNIRQIVTSQNGVESCHEILLAQVGKNLHVTMHCTFGENLTVHKVHDISSNIEEEIKREMKDVADVVIHSEPSHRREHAATI